MPRIRPYLTSLASAFVLALPALAGDQAITINGTDGFDPTAVATFVTKFEGELHTLDISIEDSTVELDVTTENPTNGLWHIESTRPDGATFYLADASAHQDHSSSFTFKQKTKGGGGGGGGGNKTYEAISQQIQIFASYPGEPGEEVPRPTSEGDGYYGIILPDNAEKPVRIRLVYNREEGYRFSSSTISLEIASGLKIVNRDEGKDTAASIAEELLPGTEVTFDVIHDSENVPVLTQPQPITLILTDQFGAIHEDEVKLAPFDIIADTNRDGDINPDTDAKDKDEWTNKRGAIYSVNFDRDGSGTHNGLPVADAITWWDTSGTPIHESWKIENEADEKDITPFDITVPDLPTGTKAYLTLGHSEQLHAIHVFPRIEAARQAIWGGFGVAGRPWTDDDAKPLDIEITRWLRPQPTDISPGEIKAGTYRLGLEGLVFRGMPIPNGTLNGNFGGIIELGLQLQIPGVSQRLEAKKIKMKVAPFLLTHNDRPTERVFVNNIANGLQAMPKSAAISAINVWMQDHVEIGHTQRPGGPLMKMTFVCPYQGNILAKWPLSQLLKPGKGLFGLGVFGDVMGNYGGNIELSHPRKNFPLGRIVAGDDMSAVLQNFFSAQEIQSPVFTNLDFTEVKHVDEVVSIGPDGKAFVPDPVGAITLLQNAFPTIEDKLRGVLFSEDTQRAMTAPVFASTFSPEYHFLILNLDYNTHQRAWQPYANGYLRIVGLKTSAGQVARISGISKATAADHPTVNVAGKMKLSVSLVWKTNPHDQARTRKASQRWNNHNGSPGADWKVTPKQGDRVVVVKTSKRWRGNCPAIITVGEILQDANFTTFNQKHGQKIANANTVLGFKTTIPLPSLFYPDFNTERGFGVAMSPNSANLQWVDGQPVNPKPFGPRNAKNIDVFEQAIQQAQGGQVFFIDDWAEFHVYSGEVHCGSAAENSPDSAWWLKINP